MEIFVKKHNQALEKVIWLNSLPIKYKDKIVEQVL